MESISLNHLIDEDAAIHNCLEEHLHEATPAILQQLKERVAQFLNQPSLYNIQSADEEEITVLTEVKLCLSKESIIDLYKTVRPQSCQTIKI